MNTQAMRTLTVSLSPRQIRRLQQAVESGSYASNSEVVREALRLWEERQARHTEELDLLRRAYREGIASGAGRELDSAALLNDLKGKA